MMYDVLIIIEILYNKNGNEIVGFLRPKVTYTLYYIEQK